MQETNKIPHLWFLAVDNETEVFVSNFFHFEQPAIGADVSFLQFFGAVDNGRTARPGDAVVVALTKSPDGRNAGLQQEVLSQVRDALFGEHQVWFQGNNVVALFADVFFFQLEKARKILRDN